LILWFAGGACLAVLVVFGDPRIDLRWVALGAVLPDLPLRLTPLHSLTACAAVMVAVMAATRRGSARRRGALAVPIGMLLHLVLDGMWTRTDVFWWPFTGWSFPFGRLPSLDRPALLLVAQEAAGLAMLLSARSRLRAARPC
jgi:hypothetical protein